LSVSVTCLLVPGENLEIKNGVSALEYGSSKAGYKGKSQIVGHLSNFYGMCRLNGFDVYCIYLPDHMQTGEADFTIPGLHSKGIGNSTLAPAMIHVIANAGRLISGAAARVKPSLKWRNPSLWRQR
jgi:hypothetical protein